MSSEQLPVAVIVTGVPTEVFSDAEQKMNFCALFTGIESDCRFDFLRSFRRIRVTFHGPESATAAKLLTQHHSFHGVTLKTYFAQRVVTSEEDDGHLKLPPLEKQFLISPPASPPVGWEQTSEMAPVVCSFDLMARLAAFAIDDAYRVHGGSEDQPTIVIHPCPGETETEQDETRQSSLPRPRTPRPPTPNPPTTTE